MTEFGQCVNGKEKLRKARIILYYRSSGSILKTSHRVYFKRFVVLTYSKVYSGKISTAKDPPRDPPVLLSKRLSPIQRGHRTRKMSELAEVDYSRHILYNFSQNAHRATLTLFCCVNKLNASHRTECKEKNLSTDDDCQVPSRPMDICVLLV